MDNQDNNVAIKRLRNKQKEPKKLKRLGMDNIESTPNKVLDQAINMKIKRGMSYGKIEFNNYEGVIE